MHIIIIIYRLLDCHLFLVKFIKGIKHSVSKVKKIPAGF